MSRVASRAAARSIPRCSRAASPTWSPMVWSGDRLVIGSWKIIAIRSPRIARITGPSRGRPARSVLVPVAGSVSRTWPEMRARSGSSPMMAWPMVDLPEPDSPTIATVDPPATENETPSTARIGPMSA